MVQIKKETVNMWEYKVANNTNIAKFVCLWKPRIVTGGHALSSSIYLSVHKNITFMTQNASYPYLPHPRCKIGFKSSHRKLNSQTIKDKHSTNTDLHFSVTLQLGNNETKEFELIYIIWPLILKKNLHLILNWVKPVVFVLYSSTDARSDTVDATFPPI